MSFYLGIDYYQRAYTSVCFDASDFDNGGSDRLIDAVVAWGAPEKIKQRVAEYAKACATRVVLSPIRAAQGRTENKLKEIEHEWQAGADLDSLEKLAPVLL
jgi:hypothetical protein